MNRNKQSGKFSSSSTLIRASKSIVRRSIQTLINKKKTSKYHQSCCKTVRLVSYKKMDTDQALPSVNIRQDKGVTPRHVSTSISNSKTPSSVAKKPTEGVLNRPLFGYRTPNPTTGPSAIGNPKLTMTMGAKPVGGVKSRLPVSTNMGRVNPTKSAPATGIVKQRLQFFSNQSPRQPVTTKTPINDRLAAIRDNKKPLSPFERLYTPKNQQSVVKKVVETKNSVAKSSIPARGPALMSKTPAPKRTLPSAIEKKISRTVDCAKSIKRRSIKFLNNKNENRISRSRVSILAEMDSRCLIVTPEIMRQLITTKDALTPAHDEPAEKSTQEAAEKEEELIKVHTVKSSSLLKFLLCESAKKASAAMSILASPFTQASPSKPVEVNQSKDLIVWDESQNGSKIEEAAANQVEPPATTESNNEVSVQPVHTPVKSDEKKELEIVAPNNLRIGISQTPQNRLIQKENKDLNTVPRLKNRLILQSEQTRPSLAEFLDLEKKASETTIIQPEAVIVNETMNKTQPEPIVEEVTPDEKLTEFVPETQLPVSDPEPSSSPLEQCGEEKATDEVTIEQNEADVQMEPEPKQINEPEVAAVEPECDQMVAETSPETDTVQSQPDIIPEKTEIVEELSQKENQIEGDNLPTTIVDGPQLEAEVETETATPIGEETKIIHEIVPTPQDEVVATTETEIESDVEKETPPEPINVEQDEVETQPQEEIPTDKEEITTEPIIQEFEDKKTDTQMETDPIENRVAETEAETENMEDTTEKEAPKTRRGGRRVLKKTVEDPHIPEDQPEAPTTRRRGRRAPAKTQDPETCDKTAETGETSTRRETKRVTFNVEQTETEDEQPAVVPKKTTRRGKAVVQEAAEAVTNKRAAKEEVAPTKRQRGGRKTAKQTDQETADDEPTEPAARPKTRRAAKKPSDKQSSSEGEMVMVSSSVSQTDPIDEPDENTNPEPKKRARKAAVDKEEQTRRDLRKSMVLTRAQRARLQTKN